LAWITVRLDASPLLPLTFHAALHLRPGHQIDRRS
jgi:hypothetical protein